MLRHLPRFIGFVYARFPLARLALALTLLATTLEYATFSLMLPLSGQAGSRSAAMVYSFWEGMADGVAAPAGPQTWLWFFLLLLALRTALEFFLVWANTRLSKQVHAYLGNGLFSQVVEREPLARIFNRTIGHYISIAGDDTSRAGNIILYFCQLLAAVLDAAAGLVLLFIFSKVVFLATMGFFALSVAFVLLLLFYLMRLNFRVALQSRSLGTYFMDALNGIRSLRSMAAEAYVVRNYRDGLAFYLRDLLHSEMLKQAMRTGPALLLVLIGIAMAWPGSTLANQDREPLYFVALTLLLVRVFVAMGTVVTKGERMFSDIRAAHDIDELLAAPGAEHATGVPDAIHGRITTLTLSNVSCGYSAGIDILSGVSGEFRAGRVYALLGESGAGKSTLADVLLGLLPVSGGDVRFNGKAISAAASSSLRRRVVLVEQQTRLFTGSIRENILLGHAATQAQVAAAVDAAALSQFTSEAKGGLDFQIEYQGANLSGGQRQRVGIARALVRDPDVLILDEATSALDQEIRDRVLDQVRALMSDRILILITHDLQVAALADEVWQVVGGAVSVSERR
jgi:ABC-type bacteriocin/lantibiotic exporter with double-glycine peptidase domain